LQIIVTKRLALIVGVVVAGVGLWFLLDWLIVTDADRVEQTLGRLSEAVERGDTGAVKAEVDETFALGKIDIEGLEPWLEDALKHYGPLDISMLSTDVETDADVAKVNAETWVEGERILGRYRIDWKLELVRRGETWKLRRLQGFIQPGNRELPLADIGRLISP